MKEKLIVSSFSLLASLGMYFYARHLSKDAVPYVMVGGFLGAVIGESIVSFINRNSSGDKEE